MSPKGTLTQLVAGDVFAGKFRLDRQFASGGMGVVWRAWNMQLDIPVAVKVMASAMADSPDFVARFELEARAAAQIRSPHVVNVYEHGVHEHLPYMVMELLDGEDLSQRLKREKRLTMLSTAKIVREMCKALQRAHDLGIVHRDLKPANVFLARDGDEESVKVLDFGIAKLTQGGGASITATGQMMGTPSYMSPEHIRASKHVDHRADLWSVSIIAYRCLVGQLPFTGNMLDMVDLILSGTAPPPSSLAADLSPAVDAFFAHALTRDINQRFQSARELSDALGKLIGRESLFEASPLADAGRESGELPTIALGRPDPAPPAPPAGATAPVDIDTDPESSTVLISGRAGPAAFNAPSPHVADPRNKHLRTLPMDSAPMFAAAKALAEARALAASGELAKQANAAPPATEEQRRALLRTMPIDSGPPSADAPLVPAPPSPKGPSPWLRPAASEAIAPPASSGLGWGIAVAVVALLVVIAAAIGAAQYLRKGQAPAAGPAAAASAS
jgi:serine/threonine-protein kinase